MKIAGWVGLAVLLGLAGCGQEKDDIRLQEVACPQLAVPPFARDLVVWDGAGHDLTNLQYRVRVADVTGSCTRKENDSHLYVSAAVRLDALRGPAFAGSGLTARYFVALLRNGQIIQKNEFEIGGNFAPNDDHLSLQDKPVVSTLPISERLTGDDYSLLVGMQLTQAQLDENRAAGRR